MEFTQEHEGIRRTVGGSSRRRSTRTSTSGRRPGSSPRTRCSRSWASSGLSASTSPRSTAAWASTTRTRWWSSRSSAPPLRRRADGDRRADRHGHARARALGLRRAVQGVPGARRSPATTWPRSACSEVSGGSDVAAIKTTATKDGADYVINGWKMWITNGIAGRLAVPARQHRRRARPPEQVADHRADARARASQIARKLDKLGMRASDTAPIFFEDVRVPQRHRIGEEGMGFMMQMLQFQEERLSRPPPASSPRSA